MSKIKPWESHNFGIPAEQVYCLNCNLELDPRLEPNYCVECLKDPLNSLADLIDCLLKINPNE